MSSSDVLAIDFRRLVYAVAKSLLVVLVGAETHHKRLLKSHFIAF